MVSARARELLIGAGLAHVVAVLNCALERPLQSQVSGLKLELAELRGELKAKSALAEMEARLMRLETPTRLKTVG